MKIVVVGLLIHVNVHVNIERFTVHHARYQKGKKQQQQIHKHTHGTKNGFFYFGSRREKARIIFSPPKLLRFLLLGGVWKDQMELFRKAFTSKTWTTTTTALAALNVTRQEGKQSSAATY